VVEIPCGFMDILYPGYWGRPDLHVGKVGLQDKPT
jgi:hypothetical protein